MMAEPAEENGLGDYPILFHEALKADNSDRVKELLSSGADVNHCFESGIFFRYPAHICCEKGHVDTLKVLIENEANLECVDQWGQRPLHYCVKKRQHRTLEYLLEEGVNVNAQDGFGRSPLFYAIELGDRLMVELLLDSGSLVDAQDSYGQTPLHVAASRDIFCWILQRMLQQPDVNVDRLDKRKKTPLQHAVLTGSVSGVQALLMAQANPDTVDYKGMTPLLNAVTAFRRSAVEEAHVEKIEWLVKFGADVNKANPSTGRSPLHVLVGTKQNCDHLFRLFVKYGVDVNQTSRLYAGQVSDSNDCSPLILALLAGNQQAARLLIRENCDTSPIGTVSILGNITHVNALDICITHGLIDMFELLIEAGATLDCSEYFERIFGDATYLTDVPRLLKVLSHHISNVPPLMRLCRTTIRRSCGPGPDGWIGRLGLPKYLMNYVLLENEL